jgi:uncharacterized protein (DUF1800 family)
LELFTLGVVDQNGVPNYTEDDVTAAARAWTGHSIDWKTYQYKFYAGEHDAEAKSLMGQSRNWDGPDIVNYVLQENTAKKLVACKFLSKKLWEHFAYQNPSKALVDELAQVLYNNDFAIKPWVKAMLMRDEFTAPPRCRAWCATRWSTSSTCSTSPATAATLNPQWYVEGMGQVPFAPPDVSGWKTNRYWVNTSVFGCERVRERRRRECARTTATRWARSHAGAGRRLRRRHVRRLAQHGQSQRSSACQRATPGGVVRRLVGEHQPAHDDDDDPRIPRGLKDDER